MCICKSSVVDPEVLEWGKDREWALGTPFPRALSPENCVKFYSK